MTRSRLLCVVTCALSLSGCLERKGAPIGPEIGFGQNVSIGGGVGAVDVLFVVDNSGSMEAERARLAREVGRLVTDLVTPPRGTDGEPLWNAVESLRVGVATTDVGTGTAFVLDNAMTVCLPGGDDGELRGGVFTFQMGDDVTAFADGVGDVVNGLGIRGCAFEQPLEAAARVVARAPTTGFPGAGGLFAVIVLTDEEDCSVDDDNAFFQAIDGARTITHCTRNAAGLTSVPELRRRIQGERDDSEFVFAAIAGVPLDADPDLDALLATDIMQYAFVTWRGREFKREVCNDGSGAQGDAFPARRLVQMAQLVPASTVTSICANDFGPAVAEIGARIGAQVPGVCLARALPPGVGARAPCSVTVTLPPAARCADRADYTPLGTSPQGREICRIERVGLGERGGWFYDPTNEACPQLTLAEDVIPPIGASLDAECFFPVYRALGELCARGSQCETGYCDPVMSVCAPLPEGSSGAMSSTGG